MNLKRPKDQPTPEEIEEAKEALAMLLDTGVLEPLIDRIANKVAEKIRG